MAWEIAGEASPELIELARRIAEAQIDVNRIRRVRNDLLGRAFSHLTHRIPVSPAHAGTEAEILGRASSIERKRRRIWGQSRCRCQTDRKSRTTRPILAASSLR